MKQNNKKKEGERETNSQPKIRFDPSGMMTDEHEGTSARNNIGTNAKTRRRGETCRAQQKKER